MANEIQTEHAVGFSLYFVVQNEAGQFWNASYSAFETLNTGNWAGYAIAMVEVDASPGFYQGSFPALPAGRYTVSIYSRTGSIAYTDQLLGTNLIYWNGTTENTEPVPPSGSSFFPSDADIQAFIVSCGVNMPSQVVGAFNAYMSTYTVAGIAGAAQIEFQERTGRIPFIKDSSDVARVFDPPGAYSALEQTFYKGGEKILELDSGLLSCTSIYLGVTPDNTGTQMDLARQLRLMPANAPAMGHPYEWVEFYFPVYGAPSSIVITGKWGYSATVPDDVWQACLRLGASIAAKDILEGIMSTPNMFKEGDETQTQPAFDALGQTWERYANRVIARYRIIRMGA